VTRASRPGCRDRLWLVTNRARIAGAGRVLTGPSAPVSALVLVGALAGVNYIAVKEVEELGPDKDRISPSPTRHLGCSRGSRRR